MSAALPEQFISRLQDLIGAKAVLTEAADLEPYVVEPRGLYRSTAQVVVRPADTDEVAAVVAICAAANVAVVPQGGNTGLVGGAVAGRGAVILSLSRLNRIAGIDTLNNTMTVGAGCILATIQAAAEAEGLLFPLSLAAEGSCQIGGNIATNAGGVNVLRYGNARDLILGLEVVLADGRVWNGLRALRKDNTGFDLKQIFAGSEGTLGIITAAVLKLFPLPAARETALVAVPSLPAAAELLVRARREGGDSVNAFELISRQALAFVDRHGEGLRDSFDGAHPWYVLLELSAPGEPGALRAVMETLLADAFDAATVSDAVLAESRAQADQLWRIRETIPEVQKREGGSIKHDISVPVSSVAAFIREASAAAEALIAGVRVCAFGHMGDGNIHFNLSQPPDMDRSAFLALWEPANRIVHDIAVGMGGSFSAEHGIGQLKVGELARYKSAPEHDLMRAIKTALDPQNIMNPGKILP